MQGFKYLAYFHFPAFGLYQARPLESASLPSQELHGIVHRLLYNRTFPPLGPSLAEALRHDVADEKIYTPHGDAFKRRTDL
jgi:hypothetical protein